MLSIGNIAFGRALYIGPCTRAPLPDPCTYRGRALCGNPCTREATGRAPGLGCGEGCAVGDRWAMAPTKR